MKMLLSRGFPLSFLEFFLLLLYMAQMISSTKISVKYEEDIGIRINVSKIRERESTATLQFYGTPKQGLRQRITGATTKGDESLIAHVQQ